MMDAEEITQEDAPYKTSPLPAQQKANLNTLFADGLDDLRNDVYAVQVQLSFLTNQVVRANLTIRYIALSMIVLVFVMLGIAAMLGYIIGRVR